ncbi:organic cation transporter protein-like isoform X2 [Glandiceps talaboti]
MFRMLQFDDVLKYLVGEFGPYQKFLLVLGTLMAVPSAMEAISPVFIIAQTDYWCKVPDLDKISLQVCVTNFTSNCFEAVKNLTIPREVTDIGCGAVPTYSQCRRYNLSQDVISYYVGGSMDAYTNSSTMACDHGWEYDRSQYKSTVMQEYDLVCDERNYLNALATTIFMGGYFTGSIVFGLLMDRCGRVFGFMVALTGLIVFGTIEAFAPNYIVFAVVRFFVGTTAYGTYLSGFVLCTEIVGPSKRKFAGLIYAMGFALGYMLLALYAYFARYWWILQLVMTVPCIGFYSYFWLMPESPRWLLAVGKNKEAEKVIRQFAKYNKVSLPEDIFDESWKPNVEDGPKAPVVDERKYTALDLFRLPNMRKKTLIMFYCWIIVTLVYYGLSFNTSNLGGDDYINCFLAGAVEVPAYAIGIVMLDMKILGRRWSMFYTYVFAGICCIGAAFVPPCGDLVWLGITLAMLSKFSITASFGIVYVYAAELFPTPLRAVGVGLCSMSARIGGMLAPQMLLMADLWAKLPPLVFGVASIIAGVLILPLPETRGINLPETLEEGEQFGKKKKKLKASNGHAGYAEVKKSDENGKEELSLQRL